MKKIMNKEDLLHYTYNPIKRDFLKSKGIDYILEGTHKITGKSFWIYLKNDDLIKELINWRKFQEDKFNKK